MELPFNFVAKTTAKAAQVMANFNALKNAVTTIENTLTTGVTKVAAGVIGKTQLAAGHQQIQNTGTFTSEIPAGGLYSFGALIPHSLGEVPTHVDGTIHAPVEYALTFELRIQNWDATNFFCNVHASSAVPGVFPLVLGVTWQAIGQP